MEIEVPPDKQHRRCSLGGEDIGLEEIITLGKNTNSGDNIVEETGETNDPVSEVTMEQLEWDSPLEWTYMGHGEWLPFEEASINHGEGDVGRELMWIYKWRCNNDEDIRIHQEILDNGYPNKWGARRPVKIRWNLDKFDEWLQGYKDREVVEWIRYGWPAG